jgi:aryl-alcohol dehydrogenase-like predicted oxidoreductase
VRYRTFGATGITVSELGVGCSRIGGVRSPGGSRKAELALLGAAVDAGINFFDTADIYSQGQSEVLVGQAFRARRSEVVIATKGGYLVPIQRRLVATIKPLVRPVVQRLGLRRSVIGRPGGGPMAQDFSPAHLKAAVEASLRRLRTDYIDVYQLHSPARSVVEAGEYLAVLDELKAQGKILHYGVAADSASDVVCFDRHPGVSSLQVPFSLLHQQAAADLFPNAAAHAVAIVSRSCYAAGLFKDELSPEALRDLTPDWEQILGLRQVAAELGRRLLEAALQFALAFEPIAVTILGMRTPEHLRENLRHYSAPPLTQTELARLRDRGATSADP